MTLTDIEELRTQLLGCHSVQEIQQLLDDNGEDCDEATAQAIKLALAEPFFLTQKTVACPDCHNHAPDKILAGAAALLSGSKEVQFGCCECGTVFSGGSL